jgi:predicted phage tail protein
MTFDDDGPSSGTGALPRVHGAGGGGSSKGGGGSASSAPDTLFSTATVRLIDLLGEGEIVGVRGGLKGVYLNDVPVQNADDSFNFKGLTAEFRVGTPDQPYMAGYPDVQTPNNVGIKVNQATPVTVSISDTDVDRLRVTIQVPSLFLAKSDGSVRANSVSYRILARYSGGQWVNALGDQTITGKTTSGYFRSHEIALPINPSGASAPWQVQVIRLSPDTDDFNNSQAKFTNQSDLVFHSTTSIVDARFGYPHSALVGLTAQAASFGSSVPGRTYLVDGVLMPIPSNYDPVARTYSGVWDGTFKEGFSNNPAWALNLILRNDRFGLGEFIDVAAIDKWSLYEIARYCDVLVSDGKGGQEPRYVFNGAISTQQEAFELLQMVAQVFRGTVYWSSGTVTAAQDRPADPVLLVTEANALEGENGEVFSYASSGRRARHTVAIVAWNDPDNLYKQALEVVEDPEGVARYGYNPTKIDLLGCTSRGQAHRAGLWTLFTELHQTQVLTYRAGLDHAVIRPGDIVAVQDPQISNLDLSGRLKAGATASRLVLDRPVTLASGAGYSISVVLPDGTVQEREIATGAGETDVLTLAAPLSQVPDPAAVWLITGPVEPQLFRIVSIREEEPHIYAVAALQHEPGKYATIDDGAAFEPSPITEFPNIVLPPTNLSVRESQYTELGQPKQAMTLSWLPGQPFNSVAYYVTVIRPSGATVTTRTASQSIDFLEAEVGVWTFVVVAIGLNGKSSLPAQTTYTLAGWAGQAATTVAGLSVKGGGSTFSGRSCTVTWANQIAATVPPYPVRNVVYIFDASTQALVHREVLTAGVTEWTYDYFLNVNEGGPRRQFRVGVTAYSAAGDEGPPSYLTVSNPAPEIIVPTLGSTSEVLFVDLPKVADADFAGYLVWVSETPNINPLTAPSYDVAGNSFPYRGVADKTYYVRAAAYDAFSKNPADLNVSAEQSKKLTILLFDPEAPSIPGQPTLVSNVAETAPDGTVTSKVTVSWPAVASANLGYYETYLAEGNNPADAAYIGWGEVRGTTAVFSGLMPGKQYSFKLRAHSNNGFAVSDLSPVLVFTAAANLTPPANPTGISVTATFEKVVVTFTPPANKDLAYVEVWAAGGTFTDAAPIAGATQVGRVPFGQTAFWDSLSTGGIQTYWLRSVNTSGTPATGYVRAGTATSPQIQAGALAAGIVGATQLASNIAAPTVVATLPTTKTTQFVTLASDGKLYRWDAAQSKYVYDTFDQNQITGLRSDQIAGLDAAKVAGQLTQATMGLAQIIGTVGGKLTAAQIEGITAAQLTTKITTTQITDGSITTPLIAAGAVQTANLSAGAVTASKLSIGSMAANLIVNGDFEEVVNGVPVGWSALVPTTAGSSYAAFADSTYSGKTCLLLSKTTTDSASSVATISTRAVVEAGAAYELSLYLASMAGASAAGFYATVFWYDGNDTYVAETGALTNLPVDNTWTRRAAFATAPANARYARVGLYNSVNSTIRYLGVDALAFRRAVGTTLIENGAITTDKLVAGSVTTSKLAVVSANFAYNPDLSQGILGWSAAGTMPGLSAVTGPRQDPGNA